MKPDSKTKLEEDFWDLSDSDLDLDDLSVDSAVELENGPSATAQGPSAEADSSLPVEESSSSVLSGDTPEAESHTAKGKEADQPTYATEKTPLTALEKNSLLVVILFLFGAVAWGLSTFYNHAPEGTLVVFDENFPVEGKLVSVAEIETYWRKPVRKGVNADRVRLNARLIPCARVKLTGGGDAALAFSFRDGEKALIGDSISLAVVDGKFMLNGSEEIVINSTAGFTDLAEINSHINGDVPPWSLLVTEGEPGQTPSFKDKDKQLAVVRLQTTVRDPEKD